MLEDAGARVLLTQIGTARASSASTARGRPPRCRLARHRRQPATAPAAVSTPTIPPTSSTPPALPVNQKASASRMALANLFVRARCDSSAIADDRMHQFTRRHFDCRRLGDLVALLIGGDCSGLPAATASRSSELISPRDCARQSVDAA